MSDLEFTKKPRRMTSPPQNQCKWLVGYEGVEVLLETDPARMAYFAREATWGDIMREPTEEDLRDTLAEVSRGAVLGAAYKGGLGFRIRASRSTMDQMLRLAEGSGGAGSGAGAQTTRDNDMRDYNIIVPNTIEDLKENSTLLPWPLYQRVVNHIEDARALYGDLVDAGIPPQDARYVAMPLGFQTQWFHIMSAGNMIKMCEQRMCNGLTQHETNYLVRLMRDLVVLEQPWLDQQLRSSCEKRGECASKTMLFPPCGAFIKSVRPYIPGAESADSEVGEIGEAIIKASDDAHRLEISHYDPERHLYQAEQNDGMQFAAWDIERTALEAESPEAIFSMATPPRQIGLRNV